MFHVLCVLNVVLVTRLVGDGQVEQVEGEMVRQPAAAVLLATVVCLLASACDGAASKNGTSQQAPCIAC